MKYTSFLLIAAFSAALLNAQTPSTNTTAKGLEDQLDTFMAKVLERREIDWERLHDYVFSERESLEIKGGLVPIENLRREYLWRVKDGYLVRTPVRANGVKLSEKEQAREESEWIERQKRSKGRQLERESFFGFKFQPGRYLYAGKKKVGDRELMVIEYYPDLSGDNDQAERDDDSDTSSKKPDSNKDVGWRG